MLEIFRVVFMQLKLQIYWSYTSWSWQSRLEIASVNFFIVSVSNILISLFVQNSETTILYQKSCLLMGKCVVITAFFIDLSMLTIAIAGIDRFQIIKHFENFKTLWAKTSVLEFISIHVFLAFLQTLMSCSCLLDHDVLLISRIKLFQI